MEKLPALEFLEPLDVPDQLILYGPVPFVAVTHAEPAVEHEAAVLSIANAILPPELPIVNVCVLLHPL